MRRTIVYGVAGEGLGHSIRSKALSYELLKDGNDIIFLVGKNSSKILKKEFYGHPNVSFIEIPILEFFFEKSGKVNYFRTALKSVKYFLKKNKVSKDLSKVLLNADLFISDYEPISASIGNMLNKKIITVDSQHIYDYASFKTVPFHRWINFLFIRMSTHIFCSKCDYSIIVHFNKDERMRKNAFPESKIVGPFIRNEIIKSEPKKGKHILVYVHESVGDDVVEALREYNDEAIIYGLGSKPSLNYGRIKYKEICEKNFIQDLISAQRVICTAGTTLPGECLYLGKDFFVIPIPKQIEQEFNAYFLNKMNIPYSKKNIYQDVKDYLYRENDLNSTLQIESGTLEAKKIISEFLNKDIKP